MRGANKIVTIWNKWRNPATSKDEWFRHVVPRVSWEVEIVSTATASGAVTGAVYNILIEEHPDYRERRIWVDLSAEDKAARWTLGNGDLIGLGELVFNITGQTGAASTDALNKFAPNIFTVKTISDNTAIYKRGKHYRATGV